MNPEYASRPANSPTAVTRVVALGEVLLRLSPPGEGRLLQAARFDAAIGGAEANVAVSLACLGDAASLITVLPDNPLGRGALAELRRHGVDMRNAVLQRGGRLGLYFTEGGAGLRPIEVVYDRVDSAFSLAASGAFNWHEALRDADWLHVSGVTPALGAASAQLTLDALAAAATAGVRVSFDCNFRATLWHRWGGDAAQVLRQCATHAHLLFADARALAMLLGNAPNTADPGSALDFEALAGRAFDVLPAVQRIAATHRIEHSADHHELGGMLATRSALLTSRRRVLLRVVGRIGSGDAFAAGLLHALGRGLGDAAALEFGAAAACLKHSYPGDANLATRAEIEALLEDTGFGVRR